MELEAHGQISKIDKDRRQVFGFAYVTHDVGGNVVVDKSGEFIDDYEELEKAAYKFVLNSRAGGAGHKRDENGVIVKSTMIESVVLTPEKCTAMGIPAGTVPTGWWVGFQVEDEEVWKSVKDGSLTAFSVHGKGVRKAV